MNDMIIYYYNTRPDRIFREPILFFFNIMQDILDNSQTQRCGDCKQIVFRSEYFRNGILKYCVSAKDIGNICTVTAVYGT
jgi:hypothetical protein